MRVRVTKPITIHGRYYATGDIVESTPQIDSYRRMLRWEKVDGSTPLRSEEALMAELAGDLSGDSELAGLKKKDLVALAKERGLPVAAKATRKDLIELLG